MQRSPEEQELLGRAEEMVKAHMAKCVPHVPYRETTLTILKDMILLTIGLMVCRPRQRSTGAGHTDLLVDRVRRMALKLASATEQKPDMLVLELIALFHDMAGTSQLIAAIP